VRLLLLLSVAAVAPPAAAGPARPPGPAFGLSAGLGRGVVDYTLFDTPFAGERGRGPALGLCAAREFDAQFALGVRGLAWKRAFANTDGDDETWTCTLGAAVLAWRPGGGGFFVRGGPGWGRAEVEFDYGSVKVTGARSGPAALLACGWTGEIGRGVSAGPSIEVGAIRLENAWRANLAVLSLELWWRP